jgi:hypothetical protein
MPSAAAAPADDVAEHRARLDRGELARVTDEDQPRVAAHRLGEPRHQRQGDHRGLVDDDHVVGQAVRPVVTEAAVAARAPAEQAVQRRGLECLELRTDGVVDGEPAASAWTASSRRAAALPVGAASATSGERAPAAAACSAISATMRATVVVLPVPGPPATTAKRRRTAVAAASRCRSSPAVAAEEPGEAVGEHVLAHGVRHPLGEGAQVRGEPALLAPVAVQVERRVLHEPQRPGAVAGVLAHARQPAGGHRRGPRPGLGPRKRREVTGSSASTVAVCAIVARST